MVAGMGNRTGGADISAAQAGDTIVFMLDDTEPFLFVKLENLGRADINTHLAAAAGLFMDGDFKFHITFLLMARGAALPRVIAISSGMPPKAWVAQERQGS